MKDRNTKYDHNTMTGCILSDVKRILPINGINSKGKKYTKYIKEHYIM